MLLGHGKKSGDEETDTLTLKLTILRPKITDDKILPSSAMPLTTCRHSRVVFASPFQRKVHLARPDTHLKPDTEEDAAVTLVTA